MIEKPKPWEILHIGNYTMTIGGKREYVQGQVVKIEDNIVSLKTENGKIVEEPISSLKRDFSR